MPIWLHSRCCIVHGKSKGHPGGGERNIKEETSILEEPPFPAVHFVVPKCSGHFKSQVYHKVGQMGVLGLSKRVVASFNYLHHFGYPIVKFRRCLSLYTSTVCVTGFLANLDLCKFGGCRNNLHNIWKNTTWLSTFFWPQQLIFDDLMWSVFLQVKWYSIGQLLDKLMVPPHWQALEAFASHVP